MIYGWEKYESYQDTSLSKALAALILLQLRGEEFDKNLLEQKAFELLVEGNYSTNLPTIDSETLYELAALYSAKEVYIPGQEPVFLLRAKDPLAISTVEHWITKAKASGVSADRIKSAEDQLLRMKEYTPK